METSHDLDSAIAADKAFHLAILDATHNRVFQGFRGAIDTILSTVFLVAVGSTGWFDDNLPNHAAVARAIDEGYPRKARTAMEQVLGFTASKLAKKKSPAAQEFHRLRGQPSRSSKGSNMYRDMKGSTHVLASPEIAVVAIPEDERVWVPQAPDVWFRPLMLNTRQGQWCNLLRVRRSGVLSRHLHPNPVHGFVLKGKWFYREHKWVATKAPMCSSRRAKFTRWWCRKTRPR